MVKSLLDLTYGSWGSFLNTYNLIFKFFSYNYTNDYIKNVKSLITLLFIVMVNDLLIMCGQCMVYEV